MLALAYHLAGWIALELLLWEVGDGLPHALRAAAALGLLLLMTVAVVNEVMEEHREGEEGAVGAMLYGLALMASGITAGLTINARLQGIAADAEAPLAGLLAYGHTLNYAVAVAGVGAMVMAGARMADGGKR